MVPKLCAKAPQSATIIGDILWSFVVVVFFRKSDICYCQTPNELLPAVVHSFNIRWRYIPFDDVIFF